MKELTAITGIIAVVALFIAIIVGPIVYGIYLAFSASLILGLIVLILEPSAAAIGWIAIFGHPEVAQQLAHWLHLV